MADIASLTGSRHGQRAPSKRNKNARALSNQSIIKAQADREQKFKSAQLSAAVAAHKKAKQNLKDAIYYSRYNINNHTHDPTIQKAEKDFDNTETNRDFLKDHPNITKTERIALQEKYYNLVLASPANRQAARIQAAKNAREKPKGWLWGGTRRTRRSRNMTRRVR